MRKLFAIMFLIIILIPVTVRGQPVSPPPLIFQDSGSVQAYPWKVIHNCTQVVNSNGTITLTCGGTGSIPLTTIVAAGDIIVGSGAGAVTIISKGAANSLFGVDYLGVEKFVTTARLTDAAPQFANSTGATKLVGIDASGMTAGATALIEPICTANCTLTTPSLAGNDEYVMKAATQTMTNKTLLATGIVDGLAPITITATSAGTTIGGTYLSGYITTNPTSASATSIMTLPTAVAGRQYCTFNGAAKTGILRVFTALAPTGTQYIDLDGVLTANTGGIEATAAAGNFACFAGVDSTHWKSLPTKGTWNRITR